METARKTFARLLGITTFSLVLSGGLASAADPVLTCQLNKTKAAGVRANCLAIEHTKELQGKPFDLQLCETKFDLAISKADVAAALKGAACRYLDLGSTVFDLNTLLEWEKKTDDDTIHDKDNAYSWSADIASSSTPNGSLFLIEVTQLPEAE